MATLPCLAFLPPGWAEAPPWKYLEAFSAGAWIALGSLALAVVVGWAVSLNAIWQRIEPLLVRRRRSPQKKRRFGPKHLALILVALLPGGLVGAAAVALVLGKKDWRRDALYIQFAAVPLCAVLGVLCWPAFPWPALADSIFLTGTLGLTCGLLHLWTLLKLLRQAWGEPPAKAPWWPPSALWIQTLVLADIFYIILQ